MNRTRRLVPMVLAVFLSVTAATPARATGSPGGSVSIDPFGVASQNEGRCFSELSNLLLLGLITSLAFDDLLRNTCSAFRPATVYTSQAVLAHTVGGLAYALSARLRYTMEARMVAAALTTYGAAATSPNGPFETSPDGSIRTSATLAPTPGGGLAAGDATGRWGTWVSYGRSTVDNSLPTTQFDSTQNNVLFGVDYIATDNLLLGVSVGYDSSDATTAFNAGDQRVDAWTVAPYVGVVLAPWLLADVSFGYSDVSIDQTQAAFPFAVFPGSPVPVGSTAPIDGDTDAERWFFSVNLNANVPVGPLLATAQLGYLVAQEDQDAVTLRFGGGPLVIGGAPVVVPGRTVDLGQLKAGLELGYPNDSSLEPYLGFTYVNDVDSEDLAASPGLPLPANDDDEFHLRGGVRWYGSGPFSGYLEYARTEGREDFNGGVLSASVRMQF